MKKLLSYLLTFAMIIAIIVPAIESTLAVGDCENIDLLVTCNSSREERIKHRF